MARNQYSFEKRRREIEKKRKKEEKRQRKLDKREPSPGCVGSAGIGQLLSPAKGVDRRVDVGMMHSTVRVVKSDG